MTYLIKFEGSFPTKEEAVAFANLIEGIKTKFTPESRQSFKPEFEVRRSLQVWESTHDEAEPKPCKMVASVDFSSPEVEHDIDGVVPTADLVISERAMGDITTKVLAMGAEIKEAI